MELEPEDIGRLIQWFNAVEDLNRAYLEPEDRLLAERLKAAEEQHANTTRCTRS